MKVDSLFKVDMFIYNGLVSLKNAVRILKNPKAIYSMKRMGELKAKKRSETIYICGNGPSLKKVDLKDISCDYIVVNDFYRFPLKNDNNPPLFYMLLDDSLQEDGFKERYTAIFTSGIDTTFVLNGLFLNRMSKEYPNVKAYYFCPWGKLFTSKKKIDLGKLSSITWNVVSEAILLAIYVGYKDIRLLGCDYSVFAQNAHFYSNKQAHAPLREMLYKYCYTTEVHYEIAKYAKAHNISIINMTSETLLDAYDVDMGSKY